MYSQEYHIYNSLRERVVHCKPTDTQTPDRLLDEFTYNCEVYNKVAPIGVRYEIRVHLSPLFADNQCDDADDGAVDEIVYLLREFDSQNGITIARAIDILEAVALHIDVVSIEMDELRQATLAVLKWYQRAMQHVESFLMRKTVLMLACKPFFEPTSLTGGGKHSKLALDTATEIEKKCRREFEGYLPISELFERDDVQCGLLTTSKRFDATMPRAKLLEELRFEYANEASKRLVTDKNLPYFRSITNFEQGMHKNGSRFTVADRQKYSTHLRGKWHMKKLPKRLREIAELIGM